MQKSLPSLLDYPITRSAAGLKHRTIPRIRSVTVAARKSRPFERKVVEVKEDPEDFLDQTDDEVLTAEYLASLSSEPWEEDPPNHRSGRVHIECPAHYCYCRRKELIHHYTFISPGRQGWHLSARRLYDLNKNQLY
jgi:hypothetical protein